MKDLKIFDFENNETRVRIINEQPYFIANDVCKILGYINTSKAISDHTEDDERCNVSLERGGKQLFINESGLYSLIIRSKKKEAKKFKKWITSEVLPSIRKTGRYNNIHSIPKTYAEALLECGRIENERVFLEEQAKINAPKVAFTEAILASKTSILVGDLAKILKQNSIDMGQNRLFEWLRVNGYIMAKFGTSYNMPTQKSMDLEVMEIKEGTRSGRYGEMIITKTPKITTKGQVYFINKFLYKERMDSSI